MVGESRTLTFMMPSAGVVLAMLVHILPPGGRSKLGSATVDTMPSVVQYGCFASMASACYSNSQSVHDMQHTIQRKETGERERDSPMVTVQQARLMCDAPPNIIRGVRNRDMQ